ncbi:MAG TPA: PAS domain S-box protein [Pyrinomonadaceae bacterium]|nr:PAS domain S-box protein [Pyrinomonadaceae bacterium]
MLKDDILPQPRLTGDHYRRFIENLPVLFYAVDPTPPYSPIYVSPAFKRFGYPLHLWTSDPQMWLRVIHPEDCEWVFGQTALSTKSGDEVDYEYRIIDANGVIHWVRDRGCLIRSENGNIVCREGVMIDITEQKLAQEELRIGEERFRTIFDNASDIIYVHDLKGNYISINKAAERIFGYTLEEAIRMNVCDIVAPENLPFIQEQISKKLKGKEKQTSYVTECIRKDGSVVTLEVNSTVIYKNGKPVAVQGIARDITERERVLAEVRESEQRYRDLFENANDLIYTHDLNGNFTSINRAGEKITGYTREEAMQMNVSQVVAPEYLELAREMISRKLQGSGPTSYELEIISKSGVRVSLELSTRLIYKHGRPVGIQGIGRDITERKRAEEALKASELRYRQLGEGILHQIWTANPNGRLDYVNRRTLEYFNKSFEQLSEDGWKSVIHPDDYEECVAKWRECVVTGNTYELEFRLLRYDGEYRWHVGKATASRDSNGNIIKWFGSNTDIHDQKVTEEKLNYYAHHDPLTDLPNRHEFMNRLKAAIARSRENANKRFAVLFLDLDRFKVINDSLGHVVGDRLLIEIAKRLQSALRPGDTVARLGGDEFTILLNRITDESSVIQIVERIQKKLSQAFRIDNYEVFTTASVGIILSDGGARQAEDYLRDADSAMYRAKEGGSSRYEVFDSEMLDQNRQLLKIETDLRHALDRNEFEVHYQPIVDLTTGTVDEFEALIRWHHPALGIVPPATFINIAEETGLIVPLGRWILEAACRQASMWSRQCGRKISVSVNLSARQLVHPKLTSEVAAILSKTGLSPSNLKLEVTESTVMEHREKSEKVLRELHELGVHLSTDDFGTGYSSLSYLQQFPLDRMKIDRCFIRDFGRDRKSNAIVKTIMMLGNNLNIEVVAEGVETHRQFKMLRLHGCRYGQGFYFSPPVSADEAATLINSGADIIACVYKSEDLERDFNNHSNKNNTSSGNGHSINSSSLEVFE